MSLVIALMVLGMGLIMLEIFIPGGVVGVVGGLCLLGAIGVAFNDFGLEGAIVTFGISLVALVACLWFEFKILPKTSAGKRFFLQDQVSGKSQDDVADDSMIGREASTATALSPSGYIVLDGRKLEATSRRGFIEKGEPVRIESFDQFKVTVSKI